MLGFGLAETFPAGKISEIVYQTNTFPAGKVLPRAAWRKLGLALCAAASAGGCLWSGAIGAV